MDLLEPHLREVAATGRTRLVRVRGEAVAAAAAARTVAELDPDDPPSSGVLWLHGPGAPLAAAERLQLLDRLHPRPLLVLVSGEDAGTVGLDVRPAAP